MFNEFDVVKLKHELSAKTSDSWPGAPVRSLPRGTTGTVVMVYDGSGEKTAYEVEFVSEDGATEALLTLTEDDLESN